MIKNVLLLDRIKNVEIVYLRIRFSLNTVFTNNRDEIGKNHQTIV